MGKNRKRDDNGSLPPLHGNSYPDGGTSERSQLDWVLRSQSALGERVASLEAHSGNQTTTLERIEKSLVSIDNKLEQQNTATTKLGTKVTVAIAVISAIALTFATVMTFVIDGKLGKLHNIMEQIQEKSGK